MPWRFEIGAKIILSRLPTSFTFWQNLGLFRHGGMDDAAYAINVFDSHVRCAGLQGQLNDKIILEFGTGDSFATAIIAYYYGAKHLTNGFESLAEIANDSVDFIFSQAVLEHVRRSEFLATRSECARILRANGICSHQIDLRDHLGGLSNTRFSESVWESEFFTSSGFYTNRIQFHDMNALFERAGFKAEVTAVLRWEELPIKQCQIAAEFRNTPDQVLNVSVFDVLLRHLVC